MAEDFGWVDYTVFGVMLLSSGLIGVYFAFFAKQKQNSTAVYLMGGKTMGVFPVAMSLVASYISGISLLGFPAEVYAFGSQFWLMAFAGFGTNLITSLVYLPVFFNLQITTSYEYLNLRFSPSVRLLGSVLYVVKSLLYMPIVIYVPALALNQVTGLGIHVITAVVCCVCIFYTSLGGLKAVVWADTLQTAIMFGGVIVVAVLGVVQVGGVGEVFRRASDGDRLDVFDMNVDPTVRYTFWSAIIGTAFTKLSFNLGQCTIQRCLALKTQRKSFIAMQLLALGVFLIVTLCCACGLIMYAYFYDCDLVTIKVVGKFDQLMPYFVMLTTRAVPGLAGLFVAGVFSAALSSMSTGLNAMAGVIYTDMVRPLLRTPLSEARASTVMKATSALLGALSVALVLVVEHMGALVRAVRSVTDVANGPLVGLFTLGMIFPWANTKGALSGGIVSFLFLAWISFSAQTQFAQGLISVPRKPLRVDGCAEDIINATIITPQIPTSSDVFWLYRVSFMWYTMIGVVVTLVVGLLVSLVTTPRDPRDVPRDLLSPVIHRFLPKQQADTALEQLSKRER